jgi:hypothetical protein
MSKWKVQPRYVRPSPWTNAGLDFADRLHLASLGESVSFTSFDARIVKSAARFDVSAIAL